MKSHSPVFAPPVFCRGTATSVVSLRNEMATPARQDALEARNDKLSDAFLFVYVQSTPAILAFNHL